MLKKILVPIDPGALQSAEVSLKYAHKLLDPEGEITVLSVVELIPQYVMGELPPNFFVNSKNAVRESLEKFLEKHSEAANLDVVDGHAAQTIVDYASENGFEMIVIASHKPEMLDYLLGSTAAQVVRKATCPVLVTR